MKNSQKVVNMIAAFFLSASIFSLSGCGTAENTDMDEMSVDLEVEQETPRMQENAAADRADETEKTGQPQAAGQEQDVEIIRRTKEEWDEITLKERAELEAKVKAAGGISEEKAVEIAQKALETDLGDKGKKLELVIDEAYGWRSDLCVADWSEIKEKDRGALAYCIGFNNADKVTEVDDLLNYNCTVNAADGSIFEAYTIQGWDTTVYYEH